MSYEDRVRDLDARPKTETSVTVDDFGSFLTSLSKEELARFNKLRAVTDDGFLRNQVLLNSLEYTRDYGSVVSKFKKNVLGNRSLTDYASGRNNVAAKHEEYLKLSKASPGRQSTILTSYSGPESKTLLGGTNKPNTMIGG